MSSGKSADGYRRIPLFLETGGKRTVYVHRLVASVFCAGDTSLTVNHINLDRGDNRASNLEWVTFSENHLHRARMNPEAARRNALAMRKPVISTDMATGEQTTYGSAKEAGIALGRPGAGGNIGNAIRIGRIAYGYGWRMA